MTLAPSRKPVVVGTGLICLDLVIAAEQSRPARAWAGGTCGNVLTILSYLGWEAYPVSRLGNDPASDLVCADMSRWGVKLDFARLQSAPTPIIVQVIRQKDGHPTHRFVWLCPHCGKHLPSYRAVTVQSLQDALPRLPQADVCFVDRLSRAAIDLAEAAAARGAVIVFEPSAKCDPKLVKQALRLTHVLKYSKDRFGEFNATKDPDLTVMLEIQTEGVDGLRYQSRLPLATVDDWRHLPAVPALSLVDSCGAGDWSTAGLISQLGTEGLQSLVQASAENLVDSLIYGQKLSAWNCGFEGARGGMYASGRTCLEALLMPALDRLVLDEHVSLERVESIPCPACPLVEPAGVMAFVS